MRSESFPADGPRRHDALQRERRAAPRFEGRASLILEQAESVGLCRVVDLSITGALFSAAGTTLPTLELWSQHTVTIVAYADPALQVEVTGRIMRRVDDIYALDWSGQEETQAAVAGFLERLPASAAPRVEDARRAAVSASLLIEHGGRAEELVLIEVTSRGGLIASAGATLSRIRVGGLVLLNLARSDEPDRTVDVLARVACHEGHATRVDWSEDREAAAAVAGLLDDLVAAS